MSSAAWSHTLILTVGLMKAELYGARIMRRELQTRYFRGDVEYIAAICKFCQYFFMISNQF